MLVNWPHHGGQPAAILEQFKLHPETQLLDFSANLNPLGPPSWLKDEILSVLDQLTKYPDPNYSQAALTIAHFEGCEAENVLVTNGGAEAVFLAARGVASGTALIVHPTFAEYERACQHYDIPVLRMELDSDHQFAYPIESIKHAMKERSIGSVFLCRPNNPTGTVLDEADILELLALGQQTGTTIIVDEAFADFLPPDIPPLTDRIQPFNNLILLRSLTKMYTIPGLRIGYILSHASMIHKLRGYQMPWSVNAIAAGILPRLLKDRSWEVQTKHWLLAEWAGLRPRLTELGFEVSPSRANFYVLRDSIHPSESEALYTFLLHRGILPRHTHNFIGLEGRYLRMAVRSTAENDQLIRTLHLWRTQS